MLQKELAKRLKARYDTKMDGNGWLEVSSDGILEKYPPQWTEEAKPQADTDSGQAQQDSQKHKPQKTPPHGNRRNGSPPIRTSPPKKETAPDITEAEIIKDLTETEVQSNEPS